MGAVRRDSAGRRLGGAERGAWMYARSALRARFRALIGLALVVGVALAERLGLHQGDAMTLGASPAQEGGGPTDVPVTQYRVRLVGVVALIGSFETLTGRGFPYVVALSPGFLRIHQPPVLTNEDT